MTDSAARPQLERKKLEERIARQKPCGWIDLRGADLTDVDLEGMTLERVIFGCHGAQDKRPAARLHTTRFRRCTLVQCKFAHVDCRDTDFRFAQLTGCDLRYASFAAGTFADATLVLCDLYRAVFEHGVVFRKAVLQGVSLNEASLSGIVGLRRDSFQRGNGPGLAQGDEQLYSALLERTFHKYPKECHPLEELPAVNRLEEAASSYRALSGLWSGQGVFADAAWAYVEAKRIERKLASPWDRSSPTRRLHWLSLWFADVLCAFGESLFRVLLWIAALAVLPGLAYWALDGVEVESTGDEAGLGDCLLFSAGRMAASAPERLSTTALVEWIGVGQTFLGIALLGLFGFVLGNKLRHS